MSTLDEEDHGISVGNPEFSENMDNCGANLTEDLVEKIVSKMVFPQCFKFRVVSGWWNSKFPLPFDDDSMPLDSPFLDEVRSAARRWPTYWSTLSRVSASLVTF